MSLSRFHRWLAARSRRRPRTQHRERPSRRGKSRRRLRWAGRHPAPIPIREPECWIMPMPRQLPLSGQPPPRRRRPRTLRGMIPHGPFRRHIQIGPAARWRPHLAANTPSPKWVTPPQRPAPLWDGERCLQPRRSAHGRLPKGGITACHLARDCSDPRIGARKRTIRRLDDYPTKAVGNLRPLRSQRVNGQIALLRFTIDSRRVLGPVPATIGRANAVGGQVPVGDI
jgi:hypothetical protein